MKEIIDFLNANPVGCLATVDDFGYPHVRPWSFMLENDGKLWFCTGNTKDVFEQLLVHPMMEFCSSSEEHMTLRIRGEIIFGIDMNIKRAILEKNEMVKSVYKVPENLEFEIFYLKHGKATIADLNGQLVKNVEF
ncbi:MAG: pyridoxamine 5-phosphate oxidase-related, FMN-binding protein [Firmicutes bacterium]|nr:pyridoxamine 5-phosphate oxidase-related, FMN-binding protein [Bacillota bacterium]